MIHNVFSVPRVVKLNQLSDNLVRRISRLRQEVTQSEAALAHKRTKLVDLETTLKTLRYDFGVAIPDPLKLLRQPPQGEKKLKSAPQHQEQELERKEPVAKMIRRIVLAQTSDFTARTITEALSREHSKITQHLPKNYVTIQLWKLARANLIERTGKKGAANTYLIKTSLSTAKN